jgi:hypothetical protein
MPTGCRNALVRASAKTVSKLPVLIFRPNKLAENTMSPFSFLRHRRQWLAAFALLAFSVRALIPVGFMPSGDGFLKLQICPEGLSSQAFALLDPHAAHHHHHLTTTGGTAPTHDHRSWSAGHCSFGALAGALSSSHSVFVAFALEIVFAPVSDGPVYSPAKHRFQIAQPRGPPFLV